MSSGNQFRPAAPPSLTSQAYTDAFNQVKSLGIKTGSTRTADQTQIAYFWQDGPGTASPPGHWNQIAQIISASQGLTFQQNVRLFALLNLAEADAGIAAWDAKRVYDFWRPNMAIAQAGIDGNSGTIADAAWTPLIPTPSFPSYVSGHSTFSGAGAAVLAAYFGRDNIAFTTTTQSPVLPAGTTRDFISISQAAYEAGMSRIYGGIHFDFDNVAGLDMGAQIGGNTYNNHLQPVPEPCGVILMGVAGALALLRRTRKLVTIGSGK